MPNQESTSEARESAVQESAEEVRTGLEDVIRSLRELTRTGRSLAMSSTDVLERELAMAITISEELRDSMISKEALEDVRTTGLASRLREDAHRAVDLVADAASLTVLHGARFAERFVDQPRPRIEPGAHLARRTAAASA